MNILQDAIDTFEELKKDVFIVNGNIGKPLIIIFKDEHFYHLLGLHKLNLDSNFPKYVITKEEKYKYIKKHISKFSKIIMNQLRTKNSVLLRIKRIPCLLDMLKNVEGIFLYDLKIRNVNSLYDGDYGISKRYDKFICLLGLKVKTINSDGIYCNPQSFMENKKSINIIELRKRYVIKNILVVPKGEYNKIVN